MDTGDGSSQSDRTLEAQLLQLLHEVPPESRQPLRAFFLAFQSEEDALCSDSLVRIARAPAIERIGLVEAFIYEQWESAARPIQAFAGAATVNLGTTVSKTCLEQLLQQLLSNLDQITRRLPANEREPLRAKVALELKGRQLAVISSVRLKEAKGELAVFQGQITGVAAVARSLQTVPAHRSAVEDLRGGEVLTDSPDINPVTTRAQRRQAVVMPLLDSKGWTPGKLAAKAGVSKGTIYQYLDGTRARMKADNRSPVAEELGIAVVTLPE
jgi:hypothetical protein